MNIYVLRHGQTNYNIQGRYQGQIDVPLNETGIAQAKEIGKNLFNVQFNLVFCSPLTRAIQTAKYVTSNKMIIDERIIERSFGSLEGKKSIKDYEEHEKEYNIESIQKLRQRVYCFMNEIMKKYHYLDNILIVTHACVAIMIESYINGTNYHIEAKRFHLENGKYKIYVVEGTNYECQ